MEDFHRGRDDKRQIWFWKSGDWNEGDFKIYRSPLNWRIPLYLPKTWTNSRMNWYCYCCEELLGGSIRRYHRIWNVWPKFNAWKLIGICKIWRKEYYTRSVIQIFGLDMFIPHSFSYVFAFVHLFRLVYLRAYNLLAYTEIPVMHRRYTSRVYTIERIKLAVKFYRS